MADETNFEIGLTVAVSSDDNKLAAVAGDLDKVNEKLAQQQTAQKEAGNAAKDAADKATAAAEQHGNALNDLVVKLGLVAMAYSAIRGAWDSFKEGTDEFMKQQRALGQLSNIVKQFGQDGEEAAKQTEALARRLAAVGLNEQDVIAGAQRMTFVTGDYKQALSAASLAADASVKTGNNYAETLNIIQMLMMDNKRGVLMAHRQLGIEATTCAGALAEIDARARGAAEQLKDATAAAAGFSTIIKERWKEMGGLVASVWAPMARFAADYEKKQEEATIELEYDFKKMVGATADADKWYADAIKKWKEKFGVPLGEEFAKLTTMGDKSLSSPAALAAQAAKMTEAMTKLQKDVDTSVAEQSDKDYKAAEAQKQRNEQAMTEFKIDNELKLKREGWDRIYKAEVGVQETQNQKLLASLRLFEAQSLGVKVLAQTNTQKMNLVELKAFQKLLEDELKSERLSMDERTALTVREVAAKKQIKDIEAKNDMQHNAQAVAGTVDSVNQMFGASKAGAVASAIISAFAAAAGAAAETHGDVYTRIAAYVAAFAQAYQAVSGIEGTDIGSGGSAGGGSSAVYGGTNMSTPIPTIQNNSTQQQTNVQGGNTYVINSVVGSAAVAQTMQLQKALRPGSRAYDRTIASRTPVSAGTVRRG